MSEDAQISFSGSSVECKKCGKLSPLHDARKTEIFICPFCGGVYSKKHDNYSKLHNIPVRQVVYIIPLYSTFVFDDVAYTVTGCAKKHEKGDVKAKWEEYILHNKNGDTAFLNVSYGHWVFLKERAKPEKFDEEKAEEVFENDDGREYKVFSSYYQYTDYAVGEFPYDVIDVKTRFSREYIHPPFLFVKEVYNKEKTYFQGHYLSRAQVKNALSDDKIFLPFKTGTGSCQPFYLKINHLSFLKLSIFFFLFSILCKFLFWPATPPVQLATEKVALADSLNTQHVVSRSFTLTDEYNLLHVNSHSSVENDWIEADITLVNEKNGEEKTFAVGQEYYYGYEDGESWNEGSHETDSYLNSIKAGRYHFDISVIGSDKRNYRDIQLIFFKDSPDNWNYWLLILSLAVITAIIYYFGELFEKRRFGTDQ